jgi:hypothetical protein
MTEKYLTEAKAAELVRKIREAIEVMEADQSAPRVSAEAAAMLSALIEQRAALIANRMKVSAAASVKKRKNEALVRAISRHRLSA